MSTSASVVSIGDTELQSGLVLPDLKISHSTFGTLNATRSNAILLPTFYGGKHSDYEPMIGVDKALDPSKYFIVVGAVSESDFKSKSKFETYKLVTISVW